MPSPKKIITGGARENQIGKFNRGSGAESKMLNRPPAGGTKGERTMNGRQRAYYATRTPFSPIQGKTYQNEGGGIFKCIHEDFSNPTMQNVTSGWTFTAVGVGIYIDGRIDWDYSKFGRFEDLQ